jgi:uncharacterized protein
MRDENDIDEMIIGEDKREMQDGDSILDDEELKDDEKKRDGEGDDDDDDDGDGAKGDEDDDLDKSDTKEETNLLRDLKNPCNGCVQCCSYVAIELDEPEDEDDWQNIRWYLTHKDVWVFVDHDDSWNVQFNTMCEMIDDNGWCGIYEKRPFICRHYKTENCEKYGPGDSYKLLFKTLEEFDDWVSKGRIIPKSDDD